MVEAVRYKSNNCAHNRVERSDKLMNATALTIVIIGALNWLLIGLFGFNVVTAIFGPGLVANIIYVIVGLAELFAICFYRRLSDRTTTED